MELPMTPKLTAHKFLNRRYILSNKRELKSLKGLGNGVYYLINSTNEIVYVGRSSNMGVRVVQHKSNRIIDFSFATFVQCDFRTSIKIEKRAISTFKPIFNKVVYLTFDGAWPTEENRNIKFKHTVTQEIGTVIREFSNGFIIFEIARLNGSFFHAKVKFDSINNPLSRWKPVEPNH